MNSKLYKLALWYIKKCNAKCANQYKEKVESLNRLTYRTHDKYLLLYGADAEWQIFNKYDVLDNAIQRLGEYENIGTVEEFKNLKKSFKDENFVLHYDLGYEYEEDDAIFYFTEGNFNCDCNRSLAIQWEYGDDAIPELGCGEDIKLIDYHIEYLD